MNARPLGIAKAAANGKFKFVGNFMTSRRTENEYSLNSSR